MAGRAVYRKLAAKFGEAAAKDYLYGNSEKSGIVKGEDGKLKLKSANMEVEFTAVFPAKTVKSKSGKVFSYKGRDEKIYRDAQGKWRMGGKDGSFVMEEDLIADLRGASNWAEIRAKFFPMAGFHR